MTTQDLTCRTRRRGDPEHLDADGAPCGASPLRRSGEEAGTGAVARPGNRRAPRGQDL